VSIAILPFALAIILGCFTYLAHRHDTPLGDTPATVDNRVAKLPGAFLKVKLSSNHLPHRVASDGL
jgi:hypothetical protein